MKARKILAALGAALMMIGISTPAAAFDCKGHDPATIEARLTTLAQTVRCQNDSDVNPGLWNKDNPIWEKRAVPDCGVHERLARALHEKREFKGDKPRNNGNNTATGAAWDVHNGKYESAIMKLDSFIAGILKSRLNREYDPDEAAAQLQAMKFINNAEAAKSCIIPLLP